MVFKHHYFFRGFLKSQQIRRLRWRVLWMLLYVVLFVLLSGCIMFPWRGFLPLNGSLRPAPRTPAHPPKPTHHTHNHPNPLTTPTPTQTRSPHPRPPKPTHHTHPHPPTPPPTHPHPPTPTHTHTHPHTHPHPPTPTRTHTSLARLRRKGPRSSVESQSAAGARLGVHPTATQLQSPERSSLRQSSF